MTAWLRYLKRMKDEIPADFIAELPEKGPGEEKIGDLSPEIMELHKTVSWMAKQAHKYLSDHEKKCLGDENCGEFNRNLVMIFNECTTAMMVLLTSIWNELGISPYVHPAIEIRAGNIAVAVPQKKMRNIAIRVDRATLKNIFESMGISEDEMPGKHHLDS